MENRLQAKKNREERNLRKWICIKEVNKNMGK